MRINGLQKMTLLDYPEKVACTVFLGGCNFRCPFCHNGNLVLHPEREPEIPKEELFSFLEKRAGLLDGVCVTGGEPTLHAELPEFLSRIKALGYEVKLDTNGYRPEVLKRVVMDGLVDYVAMDIKNAPKRYAETAGWPGLDLMKINESVEYLRSGAVPYEFRTTVMRELHTKAEFAAIGRWLAGAKRYYLQTYKESESVIQPGFHAYAAEQLIRIRDDLREVIGTVEIRGDA